MLTHRLVMRFGQPIGDGCDQRTHLFPAPEQLAAADLAGLGISAARSSAVQALARAVQEGSIDFSAGVEETTAALAALPGLDAWIAQYVALRGLGEPDAFPPGDIVSRRTAARGTRSLTSRELELRADTWRPWRGYALLHLWEAFDHRLHEAPQQRSLEEIRRGTA